MMQRLAIWLLEKARKHFEDKEKQEGFDQTFFVTYNNYDRAIDDDNKKNIWYVAVMPSARSGLAYHQQREMNLMIMHFVATRQEAIDYVLDNYREHNSHIKCPVIVMTRIDRETIEKQLTLV